MKFIDKSVDTQKGNDIIDQLLTDSWNEELGQYVGGDYETLCKPIYRKEFTKNLLNEQSNYCCYCMQELQDTYTTLEHIIPHHSTLEKCDTYFVAEELNTNVIHRSGFDINVRIIPPTKYPHDIAYHNLIASCNANSHCNHKRGDELIKPLIYDKDIEQKVEYDQTGRVYCEEYEAELGVLAVSKDQNLKLYRALWQKISQRFDNPSVITEDDIDNIIFDYFTDHADYEKIINNFFDSPNKKPDLLKYKWFFHYYKTQ